MVFRRVVTRTLVPTVVLAAALVGCSATTTAPAPTPQPVVATSAEGTGLPMVNPALAAPAAQVCGDVLSMPLRDKLAQLLMVGVRDAADARAVVVDNRVGGIFIGSWTDLSMLTDGSIADIGRAAGPLALAVSVDEEGGRVQRLSSLIGSQPSARVLAATKTPDEVYQIARQRGDAMRQLGITVDFAPVVDVTAAADDTVIGDRSFGSDPAVVTAYAGAYARGLRDAGLLPVLKHFPGHGHGFGDTHTGAVVTPPLADLQNDDLVPYRTLVGQGPVGVMLGHMQVPELTGADPASLSPAAYNLLRSGGYGGPPFGGVVFTDDLSSMAAINQRYGVSDAVLLALQSGADVALWITTDEVPAVLDRLERAVTGGELSPHRVDDAVAKVARLKGRSPHC